MINVIKTAINFQIGFLTPSFFSAITDMLGITGGLPGGTTSRTGYFSPFVQIRGPLMTGQYDASNVDGAIRATGYLEPQGEEIERLLQSSFDTAGSRLRDYTAGGEEASIQREQELLRKLSERGETIGRNRLQQEAIGRTGGLFTTPGMQQALAEYEQSIGRNRFQNDLMAIDRARGERRLLETEETGRLNNLVSFLNQPLQIAQQALQTGAATAPGNMQSAQMVANNEMLNRAATMSFMDTLIGGFAATQGAPSGSGGGISGNLAGSGFGSDAAYNTVFGGQNFANAPFSTKSNLFGSLY